MTGFPWPIAQAQLPNGLRVVVGADPAAPVVAVNLWYDVGARHESPGRTGFAHLFEHLMFEGSANVAKNEHMRLIQGGGGTLNATTSQDRTNYFETVPPELLELVLWLEADRMGALVPALTTETLDNQREVVKNERRQRHENAPYGDAILRLLPLLYPAGHPYHHPTIGSAADLDTADLAACREFHARWYVPNNAVLSVVGDVSAAEVFALAERYFGAIPGRPVPPAPDGRLGTPPDGPARETVSARVPAPRVYLAHRTHPYGTREYDAVTVAAAVLGRGRGSRLHARLADGARLALPDYLGAYGMDLAHGPAPLLVTATARDGVDPGALEAGLAEALDGLVTEPVTDAELERAVALLTTSWWRQLATVGGRADALGRAATLFGDPAAAGDRLAGWRAVTAADIAETAATVLRPEHRVTLTYVPEEAA